MFRPLLSLLFAFARLSTAWPDLPLKTSGRWIVNSKGENVTYAGANWQGAAEAMLPEGLQYQSIESIVSKVKELGMNVIRFTYAIEMIDNIYDNNPNQTLQNTLINALGQENGTRVLGMILDKNPQFTAISTRLDAFDAVAAECAKQEVYIHLDNHVSKATQCCIFGDGNSWFGDKYFNTSNWTRGLSYMANHTQSWPNLASMALRNELRPATGSAVQDNYGWPDWYTHMTAGAAAIHAANPSPLIFFSGLNSDHDISDIVDKNDLDGNGTVFDIATFPYADKVVFELHDYGGGDENPNCTQKAVGKYDLGYKAMDTTNTSRNIAPVIMTEWGFPQDGTTFLTPYPACLRQFLTSVKGGWMQWPLTGALYMKWGEQDSNDTWGLLNHDFSAWRSEPEVYNYTTPFVRDTLDPGTIVSSGPFNVTISEGGVNGTSGGNSSAGAGTSTMMSATSSASTATSGTAGPASASSTAGASLALATGAAYVAVLMGVMVL